MNINRESFIKAVSTALKAERDGEQYMEPGIAAHRYGDWCVFRYESRLIPSDRIHFDPWDAASFGISDRVAEMSDDLIAETAEATFDIWKEEILEDLHDITDAEY
jgi:hypothetical protein